MLFGPGGIVALVLGGWAVIWALWSVPGRPSARWAPTAVMFVGAMVGAALLTASAETVLALVEWFRVDPEARDAVLAEAVSVPLRPVMGAALGVAALGFALAVATREEPPRDDDVKPDFLSVGLAAIAGSLALAGLASLVLLRISVGGVGADEDAAVALLSRVRTAGGVGITTAYGALLAAGLGAVRAVWLSRTR